MHRLTLSVHTSQDTELNRCRYCIYCCALLQLQQYVMIPLQYLLQAVVVLRLLPVIVMKELEIFFIFVIVMDPDSFLPP